MDKELQNRMKSFIEAFEEVFDKDWKYTQEMLGIDNNYETENENDEVIYIIAPNGTFLNPRVEDEIEDWGNRGNLLDKYRKLKEIL